MDKVVSKDREERPFVLSISTGNGPRRALARAVIDASGTWSRPNPLGADGLPAEGEAAFSGRIAYGIPDVLGRDRKLYAGRKTLVVGAGHSAANALLDLIALADEAPGTEVIWATRSTNLIRVFGGGIEDQLPARGELGAHLKELVERGRGPRGRHPDHGVTRKQWPPRRRRHGQTVNEASARRTESLLRPDNGPISISHAN